MHWGWVCPAAAASAGHSRTRTAPCEESVWSGRGPWKECLPNPGERQATVLWEGWPHSQGHSSGIPSRPSTSGRDSTSAGLNRLSPSARSRFCFRTGLRNAGLHFLNSPLRVLIGSFKTQPSQPSPSTIGLYGTGGGSSGASHRSHESSAVERDLKRERKA